VAWSPRSDRPTSTSGARRAEGGERVPTLRLQLSRQGFQAAALNLLGMAANFALGIALSRMLGVRGYGIYVYALAWPLLLAVPAQLGYGQLLVRTIAGYATTSDWGLTRGMVRRSQRLILLASAALVLGAALVAWAFVGQGQPELRRTLFVALPLVPVLALVAHREAVLRGFQRIALGRLGETTVQPCLSLLLVVVAYAALGQALRPWHAMAATLAAASASLAAGTALVRRATPVGWRAATPVEDRSSWRRDSRFLLGTSALAVANLHLSVLLLGAIGSVDETAVLSAALRWSGLIPFLQTAAIYPLTPALSRLHAEGRSAQFQRVAARSAAAVLALTLPLIVGLAVFSRPALAAFGPEFRSGAGALRILVAGELVNVASGFAGIILVSARTERVLFRALAATTAFRVAITATLAAGFGLEGAAIGHASATAVQNAVLAVMAWRCLGVYAPGLGWRRIPSTLRRRQPGGDEPGDEPGSTAT